MGGPAVVDSYIKSIGVTGFHLEDGEDGLARDMTAQYRNWFEPAGAVQLLRRISDDSPLTPEHTRLLLQWMADAGYGSASDQARFARRNDRDAQDRRSGTRNGVTFATNDIGLITLPDGRRLAIAILSRIPRRMRRLAMG